MMQLLGDCNMQGKDEFDILNVITLFICLCVGIVGVYLVFGFDASQCLLFMCLAVILILDFCLDVVPLFCFVCLVNPCSLG